MKLEGLRELSKQLQLLPERVARNALRSAVYAGASVVRKAVKARAPVATGKLKASVYQKQIREHSNLYTQVFFVGIRSGARKKRDGSKDFIRDAWPRGGSAGDCYKACRSDQRGSSSQLMSALDDEP